MAHDVLQILGVHPGEGGRGAKGAPQRVERAGVRQWLGWVVLRVLRHETVKSVLPMVGDHRCAVLRDAEEPLVAVDAAVCRTTPFRDDVGRCDHDRRGHGDHARPALGLGRRNAIDAVAFQQLALHADRPCIEVDVRVREPAELGDPQAGAEQEHDLIEVFPIHAVSLDEVEQGAGLGRCEWQLGRREVLDHVGELELERLTAHEVVLPRGVEGGGERALEARYGGEGVAAIAHADRPCFGVRRPYAADRLEADAVLAQDAHEEGAGLDGALTDVGVQGVVPLVELAECHALTEWVYAVLKVAADGLLLLPQGWAARFARRHGVGGGQPPRVGELGHPRCGVVLEDVSPVASLALSCPQDAVLAVASFLRQATQLLSKRKEPRYAINSIAYSGLFVMPLRWRRWSRCTARRACA